MQGGNSTPQTFATEQMAVWKAQREQVALAGQELLTAKQEYIEGIYAMYSGIDDPTAGAQARIAALEIRSAKTIEDAKEAAAKYELTAARLSVNVSKREAAAKKKAKEDADAAAADAAEPTPEEAAQTLQDSAKRITENLLEKREDIKPSERQEILDQVSEELAHSPLIDSEAKVRALVNENIPPVDPGYDPTQGKDDRDAALKTAAADAKKTRLAIRKADAAVMEAFASDRITTMADVAWLEKSNEGFTTFLRAKLRGIYVKAGVPDEDIPTLEEYLK